MCDGHESSSDARMCMQGTRMLGLQAGDAACGRATVDRKAGWLKQHGVDIAKQSTAL
jgi:hypothetical protein